MNAQPCYMTFLSTPAIIMWAAVAYSLEGKSSVVFDECISILLVDMNMVICCSLAFNIS